MQGVVKQLCDYLNITQILTGGHNPRGNAICERVNQTMGAMIRKLNDQEYRD
jgi:transposase InsO family protein